MALEDPKVLLQTLTARCCCGRIRVGCNNQSVRVFRFPERDQRSHTSLRPGPHPPGVGRSVRRPVSRVLWLTLDTPNAWWTSVCDFASSKNARLSTPRTRNTATRQALSCVLGDSLLWFLDRAGQVRRFCLGAAMDRGRHSETAWSPGSRRSRRAVSAGVFPFPAGSLGPASGSLPLQSGRGWCLSGLRAPLSAVGDIFP